MATVALIAVGLLALLVALLFAALVEMFRDLRQIRDALGILDRPLVVDIGAVAGTRPSAYGLPSVIDSMSSAIVLFLSDRCATCHAIAAGLPRPLADELWVVLYPRDEAAAGEFLDRYGLRDDAGGQVLIDLESRIGTAIGLDATPVAFRVENGLLSSASTVPSSRYLSSILPHPVQLRRAS